MPYIPHLKEGVLRHRGIKLICDHAKRHVQKVESNTTIPNSSSGIPGKKQKNAKGGA